MVSQLGSPLHRTDMSLRIGPALGACGIDEDARLALSHAETAQRLEGHAKGQFSLARHHEADPVVLETPPFRIVVRADHHVDPRVRCARP
jgi:hypothetical protein